MLAKLLLKEYYSYVTSGVTMVGDPLSNAFSYCLSVIFLNNSRAC